MPDLNGIAETLMLNAPFEQCGICHCKHHPRWHDMAWRTDAWEALDQARKLNMGNITSMIRAALYNHPRR